MIDKLDEISTADNESIFREFLENKEDLMYTFAANKQITQIPEFKINSKCESILGLCNGCVNLISVPKLDYAHIKTATRAYNGCSKIKIFPEADFSSVETAIYLFANCNALETIQGVLDFGKVTNFQSMFSNCSNLKEVRFAGKTIHYSISFSQSSLLSAESVQSIIDGLAIVSTAQTITFHKYITLTDEQKQIINKKGWTLVQA